MRISQFMLLTLVTCMATYWMNESILEAQYFWAFLFGFIVLRNLYFSYKVSRFIRAVENITKKKD